MEEENQSIEKKEGRTRKEKKDQKALLGIQRI